MLSLKSVLSDLPFHEVIDGFQALEASGDQEPVVPG